MKILAVLALSACAIEEKVVEADLACAGQPLPDTAPPRVTVSGTVKDLQGQMLLDGVTVQPISGTLPLAAVTTDASGRFSYSHETTGVPNDDSVHASKPGFIETLAFPSIAVFEDTEVEVRMITMTELMSIGDQIPIDPTKNIVFVQAGDCNLSGLAGVTVTSNPPGTVLHFRLAQPSMEADTDASGIAMIVNIPAGPVTISGSLHGMAMRSHEVTPTPGAFVITQLQP